MAKLKVSLPQLSINKKGPLISVMIQQQQQHQLQEQRGGRGWLKQQQQQQHPLFPYL